MKTFKDVVRWMLRWAVICALLWLAVLDGRQGARNVAYFLLWISAAVGVIALTQDVRPLTLRMPVPRFIRHTLSWFIVLALVWFGEWWLLLPFAISRVGFAAAESAARGEAERAAMRTAPRP